MRELLPRRAQLLIKTLLLLFGVSGLVDAAFVKSLLAAQPRKCVSHSTPSWPPTSNGRVPLEFQSKRPRDHLCRMYSGKRVGKRDDEKKTLRPSSTLITFGGLALLLASVLAHVDGWSHFLSSLAEMKANSPTPEEFWAALFFWLFAALSHPILKPIFGVSEILHASPGPQVSGLIPCSFLVASGVLAYALASWESLRKVVVLAIVVSFLNFIGAGLDGQTPSLLGDYNIQLDDDYHGRVVKGCPAPEDVQSPSVNRNFEFQNYSGRWYWHKVHDWTQFREMYDTMLDIRLTEDGYVNTLTIKGPSPANSPLSWDKSPLMNGVRYSWVGTIDKKVGPRGVSQEAGFGVSFPNYIIDVQPSDGGGAGGDLQELIQFQCIEVGGVRLYEGIDFMSRSPEMSEEALQAMHQRAHDAGLDPYGAAPEQMHRIERRRAATTTTATSRDVSENEWQRMWNRLNVDQYLDQSLK